MLDLIKKVSGIKGECLSGIGCCIGNYKVAGSRTQPCYEAPDDTWFKTMVCYTNRPGDKNWSWMENFIYIRYK